MRFEFLSLFLYPHNYNEKRGLKFKTGQLSKLLLSLATAFTVMVIWTWSNSRKVHVLKLNYPSTLKPFDLSISKWSHHNRHESRNFFCHWNWLENYNEITSWSSGNPLEQLLCCQHKVKNYRRYETWKRYKPSLF